MLRINGKEYAVEDRGGAVKGNVIDILCESEDMAERIGTHEAEVFIKRED